MRSGAAIHGFGRRDYELPDQHLRYLRFASSSCVHRSRAVSSEEIDRRSGSSGSGLCACRCRLCDQTEACDENDRTRDSRFCTIQWIAGDTVYGVGDIEQQLGRAGKATCLVSGAHVFRSWGKRPPVAGTAADIARTRRSSDWKRLSAGAGTKGPRLHDWCYLELADLEPSHSTVQMMVCGRAVY